MEELLRAKVEQQQLARYAWHRFDDKLLHGFVVRGNKAKEEVRQGIAFALDTACEFIDECCVSS